MKISDINYSKEGIQAIDTGVWVDDIEGAPGVSFLVLGISSKDVQKSIKGKQTAARLKNRGKELTTDQLEASVFESLAEVALKDWKGLEDDNGEPIPYSKEQATSWITSREGRPLANLVLQAAQTVDARANDLVKEVSKNS